MWEETQMDNFTFYSPTWFQFGKDAESLTRSMCKEVRRYKKRFCTI